MCGSECFPCINPFDPQQLFEAATIIIHVLQMRKLRHQEFT